MDSGRRGGWNAITVEWIYYLDSGETALAKR